MNLLNHVFEPPKFLPFLSFLSYLGLHLHAPAIWAQVTEDLPFPTGETTQVTFSNNVYEITGGATRGSNLFHSFENFSLAVDEEAFFNHELSIETIFGRVTGGSISNIQGSISTRPNTTGSTADLFFLNPEGIIFGPKASLDLGGSFFVSTADRITFADNTEFGVTNSQDVTFTVSRPIGLIMGENSGKVTNQGSLTLLDKETLGLIGSGVELSGGGLSVLSGDIEVASIAPGSSLGIVPPNSSTGSNWQLNHEAVENSNFRDVVLSNGASVTTSSDYDDTPNGRIQMRGRSVTLTGSGTNIFNGNYSDSSGRSLTVTASEQLTITNGAEITALATEGQGQGGDVEITAGQLTISDNALVRVSTVGTGDGGSLVIDVPQGTVELENSRVLVQSEATATGNAGRLTITAQNLVLREQSQISTSTLGQGDGGDFTVNVPNGSIELTNSSFFSQVNEGATGHAGDLNITAAGLNLQQNSAISTSTSGDGNAGALTINAPEGNIELHNSRIRARSEEAATGAAGIITLNAAGLSLRRSPDITSEEDTEISTSTFGGGNAGTLTLNVPEGGVELHNSRLLAQSEELAPGAAGTIFLEAAYLSLQDVSDISASTFGAGAGGALTVDVSEGDVELAGGSRILAQFEGMSAAASSVLSLSAANLTLQENSEISTITFGAGDGGDLTINVPEGTVELLGNSRIFSQAEAPATGVAGDLTINAEHVLVMAGSVVSTSTFGDSQGGALRINTPSGSIAVEGISPEDDSRSLISSTTQGIGDAGAIQLNTRSLLVRDGGRIQSGTLASGIGGNTSIVATESVTVIGESSTGKQSAISAGARETATAEAAGSLTISTGRLVIQEGAAISTSTASASPGGELSVQADDVIIAGQGSKPSSLLATTRSSGDSGRLILNVDTLLLQDGGRVSISAELIESTDADAIEANPINAVDNLGQVRDATLTARLITLDNGQITAESPSGDGGNLNVFASERLLLSNNSLISTTAGTADAGGNGGNITIANPNGFIIALPGENSDIIANAFEGNGGQIDLTAIGIFGFTEQAGLSIADLRANDTNDISASSQSDLAQQGTISLNAAVIDPSEVPEELEGRIINVETLISESCLARNAPDRGRYVVTGSGGLPPTPEDVVISPYPTGDVQPLTTANISQPVSQTEWQHGDPIIEPDQVVSLTDGRLAFLRGCGTETLERLEKMH